MLLSLFALGVWTGCLYSLAAFGLTLFRRTSGFINFAHGSIIALAAYTAYAAVKHGGCNAFSGLFLAICSACVCSVAFEKLVFSPLRRKGASPIVFMLASLGLFLIVQNALVLCFGDYTLGLPLLQQQTMSAAGIHFTSTQIATISVTVVVFSSLFFLSRTKAGMSMRALADNRELAIVCGIRANWITMLATVIASITGALSGVLWAFDNGLNPTLGFHLLLYGLVAAIIGGFRGVTSSIIGGLLVGVVQYVGIWKLPTRWQDGIVFISLLLFLLFRPQGIVGHGVKKRQHKL